MASTCVLRSTILHRPLLAPFRRQLSVAARSLLKASDVGESNAPSQYYRDFVLEKGGKLQARMQDPGRFQHISQREERSTVSRDTLRAHLWGKYFCFYRGMDIMKGPTDMMVFSQMFWHVRPRTVFEVGAFTGASAVWMADVLKLSEVDCNIYSIDIDLSLLETRAKELQPSNVTFIEGDCKRIETILPADFLAKQPHPWIVFEDAHNAMEVVLEHFHHYLTPGDYVVCEDTNGHLPLSTETESTHKEVFDTWGVPKLHTWKKFLAKHGDKYAIDSFFTDLFGYNSTSNWDGFARRMK